MKKSIRYSLFFLFGFALTIIGCNSEKTYQTVEDIVIEAQANITLISPTDLKTIIDTAEMYLILDVREKYEHDPGYVPGALNLPRGILEFNIAKEKYWENVGLYMPLKNDKIIVYCKKGKRGILAADILQKMGYTNVFCLEGGWKAWQMKFPLDFERNEVTHAVEESDAGGC